MQTGLNYIKKNFRVIVNARKTGCNIITDYFVDIIIERGYGEAASVKW